MDVLFIFALLATIIVLGFFGEIIFERSRIPDVFFLIIIGIVLGTLFTVGPNSFDPWASVFTTFALVFMLFQSALSISFSMLFKSVRRALVLTVVSFALTVAVITGGAMFLFGLPYYSALLLGMILGGTSSAVIIPMVKGLNLKDEYGLILTLESAISDVLTIIGAVTVVSIMTAETFTSSSIINTIITSFGLALACGVLFGVVWAYVLARFPRVNSSYMLTIAMVMLVYAIIESPIIAASGAIGALMFGLMLGNAKPLLHGLKNIGLKIKEEDVKKRVLSNSALNFYSEIGFFVKVFFFVYLGLLIDFSQPLVFVFGFLLALAAYLVRPWAVHATFLRKKIDDQSRVALQVLIPKGLAAAVLAQLAVQANVPGADIIAGTVLSVILLSIALTSLLIFLNQQGSFNGFYRWTKKVKE